MLNNCLRNLSNDGYNVLRLYGTVNCCKKHSSDNHSNDDFTDQSSDNFGHYINVNSDNHSNDHSYINHADDDSSNSQFRSHRRLFYQLLNWSSYLMSFDMSGIVKKLTILKSSDRNAVNGVLSYSWGQRRTQGNNFFFALPIKLAIAKWKI